MYFSMFRFKRRQRRQIKQEMLLTYLISSVLLCLAMSSQVAAQYRFDSWTTDDGLPQNSVFTILQTRDGYLWMGTYEGLARFDGVNFKVFDNTNTPGLKNNWIKGVAEDRAGNLWVGTDGSGLFRRAGDELLRYSKSEDLPSLRIMTLFADSADNLWIGTAKGLSRLRDDKLTNFTVQDGLPGDIIIRTLAEDDAGALWIGTNKGLARFKDEKFTVYKQSDGLTNETINSLAWSQSDGLWIGTDKGLNRWQNNRFVEFGAKSESSDYWIMSLAADRAGALWIGTYDQGLLRLVNDVAASKPETVKSLPDHRILAIYRDSEETIWVGGAITGLNRLKDERFHTFWRSEGLQEDYVIAVYEDRAGSLWLSTDKSLYRLTDGNIKIHPQPVRGDFYSITEDHDGNLWMGSYADTGRVWRLRNDKFTALTTADGLPNGRATSIICDRAGSVWVGTSDGLAVFRNGRFTVFKTSDGLISNSVNRLYESRDGSLWIGTMNGLSRYKDGQFTNWATADGLSSNRIVSFYEADDGAMWIGTEDSGLNRYKNSEFAHVSSRSGLYDNLAYQILEAEGDLWMTGNKGIYRVSLQELNDFADGRISAVTSYSYGTADGMLSRECNGSGQAGLKTRDGNLWIPTGKGLVRIDMNKRNLQPPPVLIEKVQVDERMFPTDELLQITPEQENLEINYTAISWQRPQHIRFKYQIVGLDRDWTDAGTRRTAYYSHLPAGEYTFRVIADNGDGVWNLEGQSLRLSVLPPFYQTRWFFALCVLAIGSAVLIVYKIRINRVERARLTQEDFSRRLINAHEDERRRVAAELHDSIGQTLAMIKNSAVFGSHTINNLGEAKEHLAEISAQSANAISEVREIAYNLRPYLLDRLGLTKAVKSMLNKVADNSSLKLIAEIDDVDGLFENEAEISIYRIIQESLNNILKHADASAVKVSVEKSEHAIVIKIEDDGKGFDVNAKTGSDHRGGFGLFGMAERVRMLGGTMAIESATGQGTKISIRISFHKTQKSNADHGTNSHRHG